MQRDAVKGLYPRLLSSEVVLLERVFRDAGPIQSVQQLVAVLAHEGIVTALDENERVLTEKAGYVPGSVLEWSQFLTLLQHLKQRYIEHMRIPASEEVVLAIGGDDANYVTRAQFEALCEKFDLAIDISELDTDGSGELESSEFALLFGEGAARAHTDSSGRTSADGVAGGGETFGGGTTGGPATNPRRVSAGPNARHGDEVAGDPGSPASPSAGDRRGTATVVIDQDPRAVLNEVEQFMLQQEAATIEGFGESRRRPHAPRRPRNASDRRHRSAEVQRWLERRQKPAFLRSESEVVAQPPSEKRCLWEPRAPAPISARENLERTAGKKGEPHSSFGSAKRFTGDNAIAPLPPLGKQGTAVVGTTTASASPRAPGSARTAGSTAASRWRPHDPFTVEKQPASARPVYRPEQQHAPPSRRDDMPPPPPRRLPIMARDRGGHSIIVQPDMVF